MGDDSETTGPGGFAGASGAGLAASDFIDAFRRLSSAVVGGAGKARVPVPSIRGGADPEDRRAALKSALETLADTNGDRALGERDIMRFARFFRDLYGTGEEPLFRHMYSEVCDVMYGFLNDEDALDEQPPAEAVMLANNIVIVEKAMEGLEDGDRARKSVGKLSDHVNLELTRMRYMAKQNMAASKAVAKLEETSSEYRRAVDELEPKMKAELSGLQRDSVAILGIFAAVVITFMSATTFSSGILQGMADVSAHRLASTILSLGFFSFNMVCALFYFIGRVVGKDAVPRKLVIAVDIAVILLIVATAVMHAVG